MCGIEWVIEALGCRDASLASIEELQLLFARLIESMNLHPVGEATWHQFPHTGGVTGLQPLAESHLACHTFPEFGSLCLNIFCCLPRSATDVEPIIRQHLGATAIRVRQIERTYTTNQP